MNVKERVNYFYECFAENPEEAKEATLVVVFGTTSFLLVAALVVFLLCNVGAGGPLG